MLRPNLICLSLAASFLLSCSKPEPQDIQIRVADAVGPGTLSGHTYSHEYFNFRITFPDEWYIMSRADEEELLHVLRESVPTNDPLAEAFETAEERRISLVSAFSDPPGTPDVFGTRILISAERVGDHPDIRTGADFLERGRLPIAQSAVARPQFGSIQRNQRIGSLVMDLQHMTLSDDVATLNEGFGTVHQRHYAGRTGDYVLLITIAYTRDEELAALMEILESIQPARI